MRAHLGFMPGVIERLSASISAGLLESSRNRTNRSPIEAITACALSHAVVQAQTTAMRPSR
jgi:hypothetical protein